MHMEEEAADLCPGYGLYYRADGSDPRISRCEDCRLYETEEEAMKAYELALSLALHPATRWAETIKQHHD